MNYEQVLQWMFQHLPMYQNIGKKAHTGTLKNIKKLLNHLGNPHLNFKSIHVAGTNGKGSTCHMLAAVLQKSGYKTGLYTSPHLLDFKERIKINGAMISSKNVTNFVEENFSFFENDFSFFEITVAMAFYFFKNQNVDIAVVETGLGGRLDSTNAIIPIVSAITNIGWDHMDVLGDTLEKIAIEKAGIIKENTPVVIGEYHPETWKIFKKIAREKKANVYLTEKTIQTEFSTDLKGTYQKQNLKTSLQVLEILQNLGYKKITKNTIKQGLLEVISQTGLKGRWQILQDSCPKIICDTAHNKDAFLCIAENLKREKFEKLHLVLGFVKNKNVTEILDLLPKNALYYFCKPLLERAMSLEEIKKITKCLPFRKFYNTCEMAYLGAKKKSKQKDLIYIGGSTFVVGQILEILEKK